MNESDPRRAFTTREEVMFFDTDCGAVVHNLLLVTARQTLALVRMPEGKPVKIPVERGW